MIEQTKAYDLIKEKFGYETVPIAEVRRLICPSLKINRSQANWFLMRMHCDGMLYRNRRTGTIKLNGG